jgi:hypothetical protein
MGKRKGKSTAPVACPHLDATPHAGGLRRE